MSTLYENEQHDTKTKDFLYELASKMYDLVSCTFKNMACHGIEITGSIKQSVMDGIKISSTRQQHEQDQ